MTDDQIMKIAEQYTAFRDTEPQIRGRHNLCNFVRECLSESAAQMLSECVISPSTVFLRYRAGSGSGLPAAIVDTPE